ncbi:hypothetical protein [Gloeocapsopsis crepidinum]|nr:hypothetical protein [Gloeocapsopsis crepidinum]
MKAKFFLSIFSIALMGCGTQRMTLNTETLPSSSPTVTSEPRNQHSISHTTSQISPSTSEALIISATGIGLAKLGMTFGQLKQVLGSDAEFKVESPFMVDFDAIALSKSGKVQYYILYPAGTTFSDSDSIELLLTDNPDLRTTEGVGSGTSLKQAEAVYGDATLSYNTQNESREYVRFANQPARNLLFRPTVSNQQFSGIYSSPIREYNETKKFQESATIHSVLVGF